MVVMWVDLVRLLCWVLELWLLDSDQSPRWSNVTRIVCSHSLALLPPAAALSHGFGGETEVIATESARNGPRLLKAPVYHDVVDELWLWETDGV
jgi:hypothetical protein